MIRQARNYLTACVMAARRNATPLVLPDDPIPDADAVLSVGHLLSYLPDEAAIERALTAAARALLRPDMWRMSGPSSRGSVCPRQTASSVRSGGISGVDRLLEANLVAVGVLQVDLFHAVIGDDRFSGRDAPCTKLGVSRIDVFAPKEEGGIGMGGDAWGVRGRWAGVGLIRRVQHQLAFAGFQPHPVASPILRHIADDLEFEDIAVERE
jgi:hypothetical protein